MNELSDQDKAILDFENLWWKHAGAKDAAIRETFGMPVPRYYQRLRWLLEQPEAMAYDAPLVNRLGRIKGRQRAARTTAVQLHP